MQTKLKRYTSQEVTTFLTKFKSQVMADCFEIQKTAKNEATKKAPWKNARENNLKLIDKNEVIDFALQIKETYAIEKEKDIHRYSDEMFKKYQEFVLSN